MAVYEITLKDGRVFQIEGAEGATDEALMSALGSHLAQAETAPEPQSQPGPTLDRAGPLASKVTAAPRAPVAEGQPAQAAPSGDRSYIGASLESGGRSVLAMGARLLDEFNPYTLSEQDAAGLYKDDPKKLAEAKQGAAMVLSRFANEQTKRAREVMQSVSGEERGAVSGAPLSDLTWETLDPKKAAYLSPTRIAGDVLGALPTTIAMFVAAYLTRGRSLQAAATAEAEALAAGMSAAAAKEAGKQAAIKEGASQMAKTSAVGEGFVGYGMQRNQTADEISAMPQKEIERSPAYQNLIKNGYSPEAARLKVQADVGQKAGLIAGAVDAGTNLVGGRVLGKIIGEGGSLLKRTGKGVATESMTESVQSGGEKIGENIALRDVNPDQPLTKDAGEAMIGGGVIGGVLGGSTAAAFGGAPNPKDAFARAFKDSVDNTQLPISDAQAVTALDPNSLDPAIISPLETTRRPAAAARSAPAVPETRLELEGLSPIIVPAAPASAVPAMPDLASREKSVTNGNENATLVEPAAGGQRSGADLAGGVAVAGPADAGLARAAQDQRGAGTAGNAPAPVSGGAGQPAATLSRDADLLSRARAYEASSSSGPVEIWTGRRGDGYVTEADARQALPGRQKRQPDLSWTVEQMPSGKYRLAGYAAQTTEIPAAPTIPARATTSATQESVNAPQAAQAVQGQAQGQETPAALARQPDDLALPQGPLPDAVVARLGQNPQSADVRAAVQQTLNQWALREDKVAPNLGTPDADAETTVNLLGNIFGEATGIGRGKVIAYSNPGGDNGFVYGGYAFINTAPGTDIAAPRSALHELKHYAERMAERDTLAGLTNTPAQKFVAQIDSIFDDMDAKYVRSYVENFLEKEELDAIFNPETGKGTGTLADREARLAELMVAPKTRSEMTADFLGNRAFDREWMIGVAKADPQGFEGFVKKWLSVIDNLIAQLRGSRTQGVKESAKVDQAVRDLNKAKMVARDALIEFRRGNLAAVKPAQAQTAQADAPVMSSKQEQASQTEIEGQTEKAADLRMSVTREERELADKTKLTREELGRIRESATQFGLPPRMVENEVRRIKARFPESAGWAPLEFLRVDKKVMEKKAKESNPLPSDAIFFVDQPYQFHVDPKTRKDTKGTHEQRVKSMGSALAGEIMEKYMAAQRGDKTATVIMRQADWYRALRTKLRATFGGFGDFFAQLLGPTSANNPVEPNFKYAVEALKLATSGKWDNLFKEVAAWKADIESAAANLDSVIEAVRAEGGKAVMSDPRVVDAEKALKEASVYKGTVPTRENGKMFGMASNGIVQILGERWGDKQMGDAPKTKNYYQNIVGRTIDATIDVWAARTLRRLANDVVGDFPRIPTVAETAVAGSVLADNVTSGSEFGFGQEVFREAAAELRASGVEQFNNVTPDAVQAMIWFSEKELWTRRGWTSRSGEEGSIEHELLLAGYPDRKRIDQWRTAARSGKPNPQAKSFALKDPVKAKQKYEEAAAEWTEVKRAAEEALDQVERYPDRFVGGVTLEIPGDKPTDSEMASASREIEGAIGDEGIMAKRAQTTTGEFMRDYERTIDLEFVARNGYDATPVWNKLVEVSDREGQMATFLSRALRADELNDIDYTRHRPGVELYFAKPVSAFDAAAIMAIVNNAGVHGMTLVTEGRRTVSAQAGSEQPVVGIRMQHIPEFMLGYGYEEGITDVMIKERIAEARDKMADLVLELQRRADVSTAAFHWYETKVHFYGVNEGNTEIGSAAGNSQAWSGQSISRGLADAARFARELQDSLGVRRSVLKREREVSRGRAEQAGAAEGQEGRVTSPRFSRRETTPLGFYSALADGVRQLNASALPAVGWKDAIRGLVNKGQVKADEVQWTGLNEWLDLQNGKVTKQQVQDYLNANGVQVEETVLGGRAMTWGYYSRDDRWGDAVGFVSVEEAISEAMSAFDMPRREAESFVEETDQTQEQPSHTGTNFASYGPPGGENYREVLLTLPTPEAKAPDQVNANYIGGWVVATASGDIVERGFADAAQARARAGEINAQAGALSQAQKYGKVYNSSHWDQPNVLAHLRVDDRTDADGKRVLFIREIQSDWGQEGKKSGFRKTLTDDQRARVSELEKITEDRDFTDAEQAEYDSLRPGFTSNAVPSAPFVGKTDAWVALALKRATVMATQEGYDKVAIINGQQAADMFDLSKSIDSIDVRKIDNGKLMVYANKNNEQVLTKMTAPESLDEVIGKDLAKKVLEDLESGRPTKYSGLDLKTGGEGMRGFYDVIVPKVARDVVKKLGGQVTTVEIGDNAESFDSMDMDNATDEERSQLEATGRVIGMRQLGFDITPAMREKVEAGVPLFSKKQEDTPAPGQEAQYSKRQRLIGDSFSMDSSSFIDVRRIQLQDDALRMKRVIEHVKRQGGVVGEPQNFYDANTLMPSRIRNQVDVFNDTVMKPLIKKAVKYGISIDELMLYAYAVHAPERNAHIASINPRFPDGGSGMTNADAKKIIQQAGPKKAKFEELHGLLMDAVKQTRRAMLENGLITQSEFNSLSNAYENYIPLRGFERIDEETGLARPGIGRGIDVRGEETIRSLGRRSRAGGLLENVSRDFARVVVRSEQNLVGKALLDFVLSNPDKSLWDVNVEREKAKFSKSLGVVQYTKSVEQGEDTIGVKVGGETVFIKLTDKELTRALRQAWRAEMTGAERITMASVGWYNSWMRSVLTRFNPVFASVNVLKDALWSGTAGAIDELGYGGAARYAANYRLALAAAARAETGASGTKNKFFGNEEMDRFYREFLAAGGATGGYAVRSLETINKELRDMALLAGASPDGAIEKIKSLPPYKAVKLLLRSLELVGSISENSTRFALYMTARQMGKSKVEAALISKNATTNFDRKGEWGGVLNSLYLFFNAGVQSTAQFVKVMKNPKVQAAMAGVTSLGVILAAVGAGIGGEDDDGEAYWDKIPSYVKERNIVIMLPPGESLGSNVKRVGKTGRYITIPAQYGFNVFPNLGYVIADMARNAKDKRRGITPTKAALHMASVTFGSFNPFGGSLDVTDGVQIMMAVAPTIFDPLVQVVNERNSFGSPYAPQKAPWDRRPDSERMFLSQQGTVADRIATVMNELGGGNKGKPGKVLGIETSVTPGTIDMLIRTAGGGVGSFMDQVASSVLAIVGDEDVRSNKIPFVSRFYGEVGVPQNTRLAGERAEEIRKVVDEIDSQRKLGVKPEMTPEEKKLYGLKETLNEYQRQRKLIRDNELAIIDSKKMTDKEKALKRQQLQAQADKLATQINKAYLSVIK